MNTVNNWQTAIQTTAGQWVGLTSPYPLLVFEAQKFSDGNVLIIISGSLSSIKGATLNLSPAQDFFPQWVLDASYVSISPDSQYECDISYYPAGGVTIDFHINVSTPLVKITNPINNNLAIMDGTATGLKSANAATSLQQALTVTSATFNPLTVKSSLLDSILTVQSTINNRGSMRLGRTATWTFYSDSNVAGTDDLTLQKDSGPTVIWRVTGGNNIMTAYAGYSSPRYDISALGSNPGTNNTLWVDNSANRIRFGPNTLAYLSESPPPRQAALSIPFPGYSAGSFGATLFRNGNLVTLAMIGAGFDLRSIAVVTINTTVAIPAGYFPSSSLVLTNCIPICISPNSTPVGTDGIASATSTMRLNFSGSTMFIEWTFNPTNDAAIPPVAWPQKLITIYGTSFNWLTQAP